jgi:hypothetical protein
MSTEVEGSGPMLTRASESWVIIGRGCRVTSTV